MADEVRRVRHYPSVFAFMLADEPDWKSKDPEIIRTAHTTVKSVDASRPTVRAPTLSFWAQDSGIKDSCGRCAGGVPGLGAELPARLRALSVPRAL